MRKSVLFVCLGNICRSPMAEAVFLHMIRERNIEDQWLVDSAGLGGWHSGSLPDHRAIATLRKYGIDSSSIARQIEEDDYDSYNFIIGMDENNIKNLKRDAPPNCAAQMLLLGDFDPQGERIIRDPYYDTDMEGFEKCFQQCKRCCAAFLEQHQE